MNTIEIINFCTKYEKIYIYGAGHYAASLMIYLSDNGINIEAFLVTSCKEKRKLNEKPIYELTNFNINLGVCGIILGLSEKYQGDVENSLLKKGCQNLYKCTNETLQRINFMENCLRRELLHKYNKFLPVHYEQNIKWNKILIVRLDGIGDSVMMTSFIRELRRNHPVSHITLVVAPLTYNLWEFCPYVNQVYMYNWYENIGYTLQERMGLARKFVDEKLAVGQYDLALLPRWDIDHYGASFIVFFSRAKFSIAYSEKISADKAKINKNYDCLFYKVIDNRIISHEVEHNLLLLQSIGDKIKSDKLELWETQADLEMIEKILKKKNIHTGKIFITIGLTASMPRKRWDYKRYDQVIRSLLKKNPSCVFFLLGGDEVIKEATWIEKRYTSTQVVNLVAQLTLRQNVALMKQSVLYIGNDTGLMHIAAACQSKIVNINCFPKDGVYSSEVNPKRFCPWKTEYILLQPNTCLDGCSGECSKDYAHCINQVTVTETVSACEKLLYDL